MSPAGRATLLVVGSLNIDLVGRAPHVPAPGETVLGEALATFHGGKGGNQATAAARVGVAVAMAGAAGADGHGSALRAGLQHEGVDVARLAVVPGPSGAALITVAADGENAITVLPGANRQVARPATHDTLPGVAAVLLQLELPLPTVAAWALHARRLNLPVLLNAAPAQPPGDALWPALDTLLVNRDELALLSGSADVRDGLQRLRRRGPRCVIVTLGSAGCLADFDDSSLELRGHRVEVVDTTGAGDTFAGVYAAGIVTGLGTAVALARANAAAALACTQAGARSAMPTLAAVDAFMHARRSG